MRDNAPYVVIATPCSTGVVTQSYMVSVLKLMEHCTTAGYRATVAVLGQDPLLPRARSTLLAAFLDHREATHLLFVDADIGFDPKQLDRLLAFDREFVGAMYPIKSLDWPQVSRAFARSREDLETIGLGYVGSLCLDDALEIEHGFATALYAGGGFQLIKRSAIERMVAAYPETKYRTVHAQRTNADHTNGDYRTVHTSDNQYALFECLIDPDSGTYLSEDFSFCLRWRRIGGKIWLDLESKLLTVGPYVFAGDTSLRFGDPKQLISYDAAD